MKKKRIPGFSIYAVIDRACCGSRSPVEIVKKCVAAKIKIIQLRDKTENIKKFYSDALLIRKITEGKALFIINDRADIARLAKADGLHLGQDDIPVCAARRIVGADVLIGKSCHSLSQAVSAAGEKADYISVGPVFKTPTKPEYKPVGLELLGEVRRRLSLPVVAIGGINESNLEYIKKEQVNLVAVVRAICAADNAFAAALKLERQLLSRPSLS